MIFRHGGSQVNSQPHQLSLGGVTWSNVRRGLDSGRSDWAAKQFELNIDKLVLRPSVEIKGFVFRRIIRKEDKSLWSLGSLDQLEPRPPLSFPQWTLTEHYGGVEWLVVRLSRHWDQSLGSCRQLNFITPNITESCAWSPGFTPVKLQGPTVCKTFLSKELSDTVTSPDNPSTFSNRSYKEYFKWFNSPSGRWPESKPGTV